RVDVDLAKSSDVASKNSIAINESGSDRAVDDHIGQAQRLSTHLDSQKRYDTISLTPRSGNAEYSVVRQLRRDTRLLEYNRVEEAALSASIDREVELDAAFCADFYVRFIEPGKILR